MKLSAVKVASIAIFAAVQALLSYLPYTITLGVSGEITLGLIGGSLIGIVLGPMTGGLAVLIGSTVAAFLNPAGAIFGIFSPIPAFFGAVGAGSIKIRRGYIAGTLILASLLVFYAHPIGREVFIYPWLHIIAMIVAFSPLAYMASSALNSSEPAKQTLGIAVAAFVGVFADHIAGSALAMWYFSIPSEIWYGVMPIYPVERIVALILVTVITAPVYYSLKKAGLIDRIK